MRNALSHHRTELTSVLKRGIPSTTRYCIYTIRKLLCAIKQEFLKLTMWTLKKGKRVRIRSFSLRITDGPNLYIQYKDEFLQRIYHFECLKAQPFIIDGGSNIGMSILYFKSIYPDARILAFEPDPDIFKLLEDNMAGNRICGVRSINAGLGMSCGSAHFVQDGSSGGTVSTVGSGIDVRIVQLSNFVEEEVDFLKLNVEGQELQVLLELAGAGKLKMVARMVVEYHGFNGPQNLGKILTLLDEQGFRYLVHDFDQETNPNSKPPFRCEPDRHWFCLVYAQRV